ncbi:Octaprenyl-diphosphate synthase / Dimethylallyltransferase / Geranyltranstransferase (farnesyldiphosphate synthase) / Geranylgeranyl pyrophosphate synthetase [Thioalkalivibrio nitratireducens DSM 14787]|uniref:Octaprenyl-diphosphate synthase / Dimethylallyltransferase / Geranyltranstransferase (Farnesyldiphosphate synthase) / Geranylgeranyl pyrophosphate synthetase n=1 Tax=Thioalkalivibrio nitratireducens (strain DSM 14787 / UNIQEM 213 / ALEN2) TaxID=1255043 RepID=L0E1I7_THIND|nr:farnesyl diphosphate synthase [Thioalkalivibrio nitratireducens]AGA35070.1 Octaprenyl-diphosphate synthase / Dimethylallyltransferase / Geranyltranstransferase (farnesyldiphosphate synthase) / Geranylgeranyl pyrophosphate synthetase [Thioalkalivibrio nitratireducens DSM 14787]
MNSQIEAYQKRIEAFLDRMLDSAEAPVPELIAAMRYSTLGGGKRLRPLLVYATGRAVAAPEASLDPIAAAVEMIHVYSLIHDDLPAMDDDDLRRGKPTCHKVYGEATAILAGDALQALAFATLLDAGDGLDTDTRLVLARDLAHASGIRGMAGGQAIDLASEGRSLDITDLETMHRLKTGALIRASVLLPAQAGHADASTQARLGIYADCIGLAFQIRDDVLDVEGDPELLGKACGADSLLEKATFPSLLGLETSRHRATELVDEALASLQPFGTEADLLRFLARYIVERMH